MIKMNSYERLAWTGIVALIAHIGHEMTAGNGNYDFSIENHIIQSEREFLIQSALKFYNMEMEQGTFEAIVRYYFDIIALETEKAWNYKVEMLLYNDEVKRAKENDSYIPPRYVFIADDGLGFTEQAFLENKLAHWKWTDDLPDILSVSLGTKFTDWKNWR